MLEEIAETFEYPMSLRVLAMEIPGMLHSRMREAIVEGRVYCMGDKFYSEFSIDSLVHSSTGAGLGRYVDYANDHMRRKVGRDFGSTIFPLDGVVLNLAMKDPHHYPGDASLFVSGKLQEDGPEPFFIPLTEETLSVIREEYGMQEAFSVPMEGKDLVIYGRRGRQRYH